MQRFSEGLESNEPGADSGVDRDRAILNYIRKSLRATRPWTRLLSVLGFIGTGLMILAGLGVIVGKSFIPVSEKAPPLVFMGLFYILASVFYLVPSIWLWKFSTVVSAFLKSGDAIELEIDDDHDECEYDVQAVFEDDSVEEYEEEDLCEEDERSID